MQKGCKQSEHNQNPSKRNHLHAPTVVPTKTVSSESHERCAARRETGSSRELPKQTLKTCGPFAKRMSRNLSKLSALHHFKRCLCTPDLVQRTVTVFREAWQKPTHCTLQVFQTISQNPISAFQLPPASSLAIRSSNCPWAWCRA